MSYVYRASCRVAVFVPLVRGRFFNAVGFLIMKIRIKNWDKYFERDRSRQWKNISWVPVPNKQGTGYRRIMSNKENGLKIYACWNALLGVASKCQPRGDLSKYTTEDLSILTLIDINVIEMSIKFLSNDPMDWIEIIDDTKNLDKNVNEMSMTANDTLFDSSILSSSISGICIKGGMQGGEPATNIYGRFKTSFPLNGSSINPEVENWFILRFGEGFDKFELVISRAKEYADYWKELEQETYPHCKMMKQAINWLREAQYEMDWEAKLKADKKFNEKKQPAVSFKNKASQGKYDQIDKYGKNPYAKKGASNGNGTCSV
jgi:hypothetical protein